MTIGVLPADTTDQRAIVFTINQLCEGHTNAVGIHTNSVTNISSGPYTLSNIDAGNTIALGGNAFYTLTINAPSTYADGFLCVIVNTDNYTGVGTGRAKNIAISGRGNVLLWPGQGFFLYKIGNGANDWQAIPSDPVPLRWAIPAAVQLNVDISAGNNANDGLATGASGALATIQKAVDIVGGLWDIGIQTVTIQVVGNPAELVTVNGPWIGNGTVRILGDTTTPANCTWTAPVSAPYNIRVQNNGRCNLAGFKITNLSGHGLTVSGPSTLTVDGKMNFGAMIAASGTHVLADNGGVIYMNTIPYDITGIGRFHYWANLGGIIQSAQCTVTYFGALLLGGTGGAGAGAFAAAYNGQLNVFSNTYTASGGATITGNRYYIDALGFIFTNVAGATYFPGTIAGTGGTTAGGGLYI